MTFGAMAVLRGAWWGQNENNLLNDAVIHSNFAQFFFPEVSVSDINDDDGAGGSSKSNSVNSLQSTGISASSQVNLNVRNSYLYFFITVKAA